MPRPQARTLDALAAPGGAVEWLDRIEHEIADRVDRLLADPAFLRLAAGLWRLGLATNSATAIADRLSAERLPRGAANSGGLGSDYPTGLFDLMRAGWSAAATALSLQQALTPLGWAEAARLGSLALELAASPAPDFAPTPTRIVARTGDWRLHQAEGTEDLSGEPILLVASLVNRWYVLDFRPGQSLLAELAGLGHPTYVLEWLSQRADDDRGLPEIAAGPLAEAIETVRRANGGSKVALIGYSTAGSLTALAAAHHPEAIARLATLCSTIRFTDAGPLARWFAPDLFDLEGLVAAHDPVPGSLVHLPFHWLRPTLKLGKLAQLARSAERDGYVSHFLAVELWSQDTVPLSRGVLRSWVQDLYQQDALVRGTMTMGGRPVTLADISMPVLVVSADIDAITPPAAAEALVSAVSSPWTEILQLPTGHISVLTSRRCLASMAGALARWLDAPAQDPRQPLLASRGGP